ncbi:hypothetical protein ACLOJK_029125 [Asimina triloba]
MNGTSSYLQEEEWRDLFKKKVATTYHYHGGCVVGSVVDSDYRDLWGERYQGIKMLRERERGEEYNSVSRASESLVSGY